MVVEQYTEGKIIWKDQSHLFSKTKLLFDPAVRWDKPTRQSQLPQIFLPSEEGKSHMKTPHNSFGDKDDGPHLRFWLL